MLPWLPDESDAESDPQPFPPTAQALEEPQGLEGLLCAGGGLSRVSASTSRTACSTVLP